MTRRLLFRSKSCGVATRHATYTSPTSFSLYSYNDGEVEYSPVMTPFIVSSPQHNHKLDQNRCQDRNGNSNSSNQFQIVDIVVAVLRKSLVTCTTIVEEDEDMRDEDDEDGVVEIGWPTDVQHVSHVTFDRFNGFLGLPLELQPQLPSKVPSASASVFGVSANSMQCSYDERGNSVPTILLMMQQHLYLEGGLQAEGIFRINADNSKEEYVRSQLNKGVVPHGIDVHCLAGLIKAWFRELPTGVLDSLSPEQVMNCNSEDDCTQLVALLPATEAALLDWAINLMADVVKHETHNKMNARNIAMVFAPNMTKMADPLTALIHAVQVMNLLKTLIEKTLGQRQERPSCTNSNQENNNATTPTTTSTDSQSSKLLPLFSRQLTFDCRPDERAKLKNLLRSATMNRLESDDMDEWGFKSVHDSQVDFHHSISVNKTPVTKISKVNSGNGVKIDYSDGGEGIFDRLSLKKGVRKLYRHPVFQLNKPAKKSGGIAIL